jgi:hypothetical protein
MGWVRMSLISKLTGHSIWIPYIPEQLSPFRYRSLPKISGTYPSRCPFMLRAIVKRHAITGSRLDRDARPGHPPGFSGDGWGLCWENSWRPSSGKNERILCETLKTNDLI